MLKNMLIPMNYITNLTEKVNAISDIIQQRPSPIRIYDQIYMKTGDFIYHLEILSKFIADKRVLFIGDGDSVGLALCYLSNLGLLPGPSHCTILDFDERIINFVNRFSKNYGFDNKINTCLYNVIDPIPPVVSSEVYNFFYTNPPYGSFNAGRSALVFIGRGMEACISPGNIGCIVLPHDAQLAWTTQVLTNIQTFVLSYGFFIKEAIQGLHRYHLDDNPNLRSGMLIIERIKFQKSPHKDICVPNDEKNFFYDRSSCPIPHYIRETPDGKSYKEDYTW